MQTVLHIDYETFSTVDLIKCGHYRYAEDSSTEIIMLQYAFNDAPVTVVDLLSGETFPPEVLKALADPAVLKLAHNAAFERAITRACLGIYCPPTQWKCTAVWASSLGLPRALGKLTEVLNLGEHGKLKSGGALIRKFCTPCKPTKKNGQRVRNLPEHYPEDWAEFKRYGLNDVVAERVICRRFAPYPMPDKEWALWHIDQEINDYGIDIDVKLVRNALSLAAGIKTRLFAEAVELTGIDNPNSREQILKWLDSEDVFVQTLNKNDVQNMLGYVSSDKVRRLLELRVMMSKASVSKFEAIARSICKDGRLRGTLLFYGAGTGRWAGRILQPQNLPSRNLADNIDLARRWLLEDMDTLQTLYADIPHTLSSLIRPALQGGPGKSFVVADFSAIEGRITAWLAHEQWRLNLFKTGGKLYETSAEKMFNLPAGSVTKKDPNRQKGKVSELALGFGGWEGALIAMGALDMGLTLEELPVIAAAWRRANPAIEAWWKATEAAAIKAVKTSTRVPVTTIFQTRCNISYSCDDKFLRCHLPSGRDLFYPQPAIGINSKGKEAIYHMGLNPKTSQWTEQWLWYGVLVENQAQAIARDCLAETMFACADDLPNAPMVLHVHDELILEAEDSLAKETLQQLEAIMARPLEWAPGLLLKGDGYTTPYYVKEDD